MDSILDSSLTAVCSVRSRPRVCSGLHYARPTAGVEPTPPGGPPRDTAGCLRRRLCNPRLAMALWPYPLVVVECT